jgi:proline-specific peptidase
MEGHLERDGHRSWYRVVGDLDPDALRAPVVICHGGPGATHDYVEPIAELHRSGRACVLCDQLGNGRSDHLPDADPSFWTTQLFKDELAALVDHLGIAGRYHVLGQSWGGMLAMDHALDHPPGLVSVVAADSPADADAFARGAVALLDELDPEVKATILRHEEAGTTDDPEYASASSRSSGRCASGAASTASARSTCRCCSSPASSTRSAPTSCGSSTSASRTASGCLFDGCSHTPHLEAPDRSLWTVEDFLARAETPAG